MEPDVRHRHHGHGCGLATLIIAVLCIALIVCLPVSRGQGIYAGLSVLPGDADCDGVISIADVTLIVEHIFQQKPLPTYCSDSVTIYGDSSLVIKRLILRLDSAQSVCGTYFNRSWLQKFLIFKRGRLVDSAAWQYVMLSISWNKNILPPESLKVKK